MAFHQANLVDMQLCLSVAFLSAVFSYRRQRQVIGTDLSRNRARNQVLRPCLLPPKLSDITAFSSPSTHRTQAYSPPFSQALSTLLLNTP